MDIGYDVIIERIKKQGFVIVPKVFDPAVIDVYQRECEEQFKKAPRLEGKNYKEGVTPNYTQPWVIDYEKRKIASERLYEFYHNHLSENTRHIIDTAIAIRDRIELAWPEIQEFNRVRDFHDYNIIARYALESGFQTKHSDLDPSMAFPTIQCQIMLTHYEDDYTGGHLRLYGYDGNVVELHKDVEISVGDLILFDKRLPHDVSATAKGTGRNRGRWMALIGAKTFPRQDSRLVRDFLQKLKRSIVLNIPFFSPKKLTSQY